MNFTHYKLVLDSLSDGVTVQDKDFNVIYQNRAMIGMFGECIGGKCYAHYEKRDEICDGCGVLKAFQTHQPNMVLRTAPEIDGSTSYFENACIPLLDENDNIIAGVEICRNITDRVSLEEEVKERNIALGQVNKELKRQTNQLAATLAELKAMQSQMFDLSRQAGMAEIASGVLHNLGNVLNTVNISATFIKEKQEHSEIVNLRKVIALLREHDGDMASFLDHDPKGKRIMEYLVKLGDCLDVEQHAIRGETETLLKSIDHIKEIVRVQQDYAHTSGLVETVAAEELVEDALRLNDEALRRHQVPVERTYEPVPSLTLQKHKVLQILINLIRNAKYAMDEMRSEDRKMGFRIEAGEGGTVRIIVSDTGIGIPKENMTKIFSHGFTTRKDGHGFGLHISALAAQELGGSLTAFSDGFGKGATFVLELPLTHSEKTHEIHH